MEITVNIKQLGKKRPVIAAKQITIAPLAEHTLRELLREVVTSQVAAFNQRMQENPILPFLLDEAIDQQAETGKVGFGARFGENQADLDQAIENALVSFGDGVYCVFLDNQELSNLDQRLEITPDSVFTFIRLTFLSGSYW